MQGHPLRGVVRWLVFPALSTAAGAAAGAAAGLAWDRRGPPGEMILAGAALAAATAVGTAISPKGWVGLLVAPLLGIVGVAQAEIARRAASGRSAEGVVDMLRSLARNAPAMFLIAMLTGPVSFLQALRLRRDRLRPLDALIYGGVGLATGLAFAAFRGLPWPSPTILCVLINLGAWAALEIALRLSRRPPEA